MGHLQDCSSLADRRSLEPQVVSSVGASEQSLNSDFGMKVEEEGWEEVRDGGGRYFHVAITV